MEFYDRETRGFGDVDEPVSWDPTGPGNDHVALSECLAATAVGLAETGATDDDARAQLVNLIAHLDADSATIHAAAEAISSMPQPIQETAEETERAEAIRDELGVKSATDHLAAALRAREWLERLAADAEAG